MIHKEREEITRISSCSLHLARQLLHTRRQRYSRPGGYMVKSAIDMKLTWSHGSRGTGMAFIFTESHDPADRFPVDLDRIRRDSLEPGHWAVWPHSNTWRPPTDVYETDDAVVVRVEIAGMREADFTVTLHEQLLTITGTRGDPSSKVAYHQLEVRYGEFRSEVHVHWPVEQAGITATYQDGFLVVVTAQVTPAQGAGRRRPARRSAAPIEIERLFIISGLSPHIPHERFELHGLRQSDFPRREFRSRTVGGERAGGRLVGDVDQLACCRTNCRFCRCAAWWSIR